MKRIVFYTLAAGLALVSGCRKSEDGSAETMDKTELAIKAQETQKQITEKAQEAKIQIAETSKTVSEKAGEVAQQISEKTEVAVSNLQVKAKDVMGELNQSVDELKKKVANFDKTKLQAYANQYKAMITQKQEQIADLTEKIKALPVKDMMSEKATVLKKELSQCGDELNKLKEHCNVYLDKLKGMGKASESAVEEQ